MEDRTRVNFTEIVPTEVLFQICFSLTRTDLAKCAFACKKFKPVCMYVLEHKRKIRLVDDILMVIFVSLPDSGKSTLVRTLYYSAKKHVHRPPQTAEQTYYVQLKTKSLRGNNQIIGLTDAPNGLKHKKLNWICASQSDVCVFVVNALNQKPVIDNEQIKELITGVTHMMSSRDVIVAININDKIINDTTPENRFRNAAKTITPILNKYIGPCFDIVPVDAEQNIGIFSTSPFPWFKGPTLWSLLVENQQQSNYNVNAVEKLRQAPFEFQIAQKFYIRGFGGVAVGRVLSGSLGTDPQKKSVRLIPHHETSILNIQMGHYARESAVAGDYVGLLVRPLTNQELRKRYGFIWRYNDPITDERVPIDITRAFRMQFVVVDPQLFALHNTYSVHYGAHRIHCVLLWIFPSDTYKGPEDVKKIKNGQAIMVPLQRVPMRVYKANEFQKNIHGKVMLTQRNGSIAAIGRIDKVLSQKMDQVPLPNWIMQDYIKLYDTIIENAQALFARSLKEEKLLAEFLQHLNFNSSARNSVRTFKKNIKDRVHYERNE